MDEAQRNLAEREFARKKLPEWTNIDGIIYPRHVSLEQCSSEKTAKYKAQLLAERNTNYNKFVDLTGGFGVDCYYIGKDFKSVDYIEQNSDLCKTVKHNYDLLGFNHCNVLCTDALDYLMQMPQVDVIYIDPARRNINGQRTYGICDCTPNIIEINHLLLQKAKTVIIKLSPMLDWHKAIKDLHNVTEVHIVSVKNECKELLLILEKEPKTFKLFCINDDSKFSVENFGENRTNATEYCSSLNADTLTFQYLYEPNASIMKSGCFSDLASQFDIVKISASSHLFLSNRKIENFPGRSFQITSISSMNKQILKEKISILKNANIATRNFPINAEQLRNKLKLSDGGDNYIFATTTQHKEHLLFICKKV